MLSVCLGSILEVSARVVSVSKHVVASIWSCEQLNSHPRGALEAPESRGPSEPGVVSETIARDALLRTGAWPGLIESGTVPIWTIDYVYSHLQPPIQSPFLDRVSSWRRILTDSVGEAMWRPPVAPHGPQQSVWVSLTHVGQRS